MNQTDIVDDQMMPENPVACNLSQEDLARRRDEIVVPLFSARQEAQELPDGYALRFPGDEVWATRLLALIALERSCCPFFTFELVFEPQQGPLWLCLRGPTGTKEVVAEMLASIPGAS
jgi:hypothetical protein